MSYYLDSLAIHIEAACLDMRIALVMNSLRLYTALFCFLFQINLKFKKKLSSLKYKAGASLLILSMSSDRALI